jgi:hypothetical protein
MSMYSDLLMSALDDWGETFSGSALIDYAVMCRTEMQRSGPRRGDAAHIALAAEIAYDRALIKVCVEQRIDVDVADFSHPMKARSHLEHELADRGINLTVPAHVHPQV